MMELLWIGSGVVAGFLISKITAKPELNEHEIALDYLQCWHEYYTDMIPYYTKEGADTANILEDLGFNTVEEAIEYEHYLKAVTEKLETLS